MSDLDSFQLIPLIRKKIACDSLGFWSVEENGIEFHPVVENVSLKAQIVDSSFQWKVSQVFPTIWHLDSGLFVFSFNYKYLQEVDIRSGKDPVQHLPAKRKYNIKDLIGWWMFFWWFLMWLHDQCVCKAPEAVGFFPTSCDTLVLFVVWGIYTTWVKPDPSHIYLLCSSPSINLHKSW